MTFYCLLLVDNSSIKACGLNYSYRDGTLGKSRTKKVRIQFSKGAFL